MRPLLYLFLALLTGCASYRPLQRELQRNPNLTDHFTGFALYDWQSQKWVVQHHANQYFTPASNTKLFSFYAGLVTLGDSIPALRYRVRNDSLVFWGTGDASLLNPDLPDTTVLHFLRSRPERLVFSTANYSGQRFGPGWAWDDYNDDYSGEVSPLPIYGNIVRFSATVSPRIFKDSIQTIPFAMGKVRREEFNNRFERSQTTRKIPQDVPFRWSAPLAARLLADTLHREVTVANIPFDRAAKTLYGLPADTLYKRMLYVSDNLLAEHLLLLCASKQDTLNSAWAIQTMLENHLSDLPDRPVWVDDSGLSRYNLFTPRSLVGLLQKIYRIVPPKRLFKLLAVGGSTGPVQKLYQTDRPFVYAKSGSMTGVYNLSGYLITKKGKVLLFSMMHNNFTQSVSEIRNRTATFLKQVYEKH